MRRMSSRDWEAADKETISLDKSPTLVKTSQLEMRAPSMEQIASLTVAFLGKVDHNLIKVATGCTDILRLDSL